jgi:hypothetical protein
MDADGEAVKIKLVFPSGLVPRDTDLRMLGIPRQEQGECPPLGKKRGLMPSERAHVRRFALWAKGLFLAEPLERLPAVVAFRVVLVRVENVNLHGSACRTRHMNTSRQVRISHARI